jgi:hypothetical protein
MERKRSVEFNQGGRNIMENERISRKIGFLSPGWWIIHLLGITAVYTLGHLLWR